MTPFRDPQSAPGPDAPVPDKLYFKIGEVSRLGGVQAHVLRYWEKEIPSIRPSKSVSNQRRYRRKDVETFREIRRLLYEERYTLAGAKQRLSGRETNKAAPEKVTHGGGPAASLLSQAPIMPAAQLESVKTGLRDLIRFCGEEL